MSDRNPSNELLELLKNQSRSAKDWSYSIAGAFWQNKGQIVDEEYLFTCLANAMMSMHDSIFNKEIKQLEQELQKTREQLNLANEVILDLMQQHIGWNDNPVNAWNYTALSADEKADDYWSKYLKDKQGE